VLGTAHLHVLSICSAANFQKIVLKVMKEVCAKTISVKEVLALLLMLHLIVMQMKHVKNF